MAFKEPNDFARGSRAAVTNASMELVHARFEQALNAGETGQGVIGILPAGTVPVQMYVYAPSALGANFKFNLDLVDGAGVTTPWLVNSTYGSAASYTAVVALPFASATPSDRDRLLRLDIKTAASAAGTLGVALLYAHV